MLEIVTAGGWLMIPIILCSIVALAIASERLWSLRRQRIAPQGLLTEVVQQLQADRLDSAQMASLRQGSPLGRVLATGLRYRGRSRATLKQVLEEVGSQVAFELQRYLGALATIAAVTPLLGLLGTVLGMISVFTRITTAGVGSPTELAGGISQALITTAAGLIVAIPSLMLHRYLRGKVDGLLVTLEADAQHLVEVLDSPAQPTASAQAAKARRSAPSPSISSVIA